MSDAMNEPQAEGVVPSPGIDAPVQPEPAAAAMPAAAAFPTSARGRVWAKRRRPCHPRPCQHRRARWEGCRPAVLREAGADERAAASGPEHRRLLTALLGAWAGLSVLVGPSFGWSPDGSPSWHWSLIHAALHVAPGGAALIGGVAMVAIVPKAARGAGRSGRGTGRLLAILAGAWLVVGPSEWPVLKSTQQMVFAPAAPLRSFTYVVGANLGPGLLLAVTGAFALAWAARVAKVRGSA